MRVTRQKLHDMAVGRNNAPSAGFLERQEFYEIGNLDVEATYDAFERPIEASGWSADADALDTLVQRSNGYPFAVQLIGEATWRSAATPGRIALDDVELGVEVARQRMQRTVFVPRWRSMSSADRRYLQQAVRLRDDHGASSTAAISRAMYGNATSASHNRKRLIEQHHVLEPGERGTVLFTIPGMAQWATQQSLDPDSAEADPTQRRVRGLESRSLPGRISTDRSLQHHPRRLVRADLQRTLQILRRDAVLLCGEHGARHEPHRQRRSRPIENRPRGHRGPMAAAGAAKTTVTHGHPPRWPHDGHTKPFSSASCPDRRRGGTCWEHSHAPGDSSVSQQIVQKCQNEEVIILGIILLVLGAVLDVPILWTIGIVLVVIGAILWILGTLGRQVGSRRHYW